MHRFYSLIAFFIVLVNFSGIYAQELKILNQAEIQSRSLKTYEDAIHYADSLMRVYNKTPFMVSSDGGSTYWDGLGSIRDLYEVALKLRPADQHTIVQLSAIYGSLKARSESEKQGQYDKLIKRADDYSDQKKYEQALAVYELAANLKPNEKYCRMRITEIQCLIKD